MSIIRKVRKVTIVENIMLLMDNLRLETDSETQSTKMCAIQNALHDLRSTIERDFKKVDAGSNVYKI